MNRHVWFYKPGTWLWPWLVYFGGDEYCRRTLVIGSNLTGAVVIALWKMRGVCPGCAPVETEEKPR